MSDSTVSNFVHSEAFVVFMIGAAVSLLIASVAIWVLIMNMRFGSFTLNKASAFKKNRSDDDNDDDDSTQEYDMDDDRSHVSESDEIVFDEDDYCETV